MSRAGRRILTAAAAAVVVLVATACSGGPAGPRGSIAFVMANERLNFAQEMAAGFQAGVADVGGIPLRMSGPDIVDGPREVQLFEGALNDSPGGVSLFTLTPDLFSEPLARAAARGVPVIAVDNPLPVGSQATLFVGNDNTELGRMLADLVIARLPAGATGVVVIGSNSPGAPVLDQRADGMLQEFTRKLPGVRMIGPFDTRQDVSANLDAWRVLVRSNPTALAFLGTGDADGWNLATIRRETHARWLAAAFDLDPRALAAVKSGDLLLVSPEHYLKGAVAGRILARAAKTGTPLPKGWVYIPGLAVTPDNIDAMIARQSSAATRRAALSGQIDAVMATIPGRLRPLAQAG
jgi:ribose transport system substrate-binding protein